MKRWLAVVVGVMLCVTLGSYAAHAGGKALAYGKHKIKGEHVDMAAVKKLLDESTEPGYVEVGRSGKTIREVRGKFNIDKSKPEDEAVLEFVEKHRHVFGLKNPKAELKEDRRFNHPNGSMTLSYQQYYNDIPIWQGGIGAGVTKDKEYEGGGVNSSPPPTSNKSTQLRR